MITLRKQDNTVLLYTKLVTEPLPQEVHLTLSHRERSVSMVLSPELHVHFYLLHFADSLSTLPDHVVLTVTSIDNSVTYYTENAKIV